MDTTISLSETSTMIYHRQLFSQRAFHPRQSQSRLPSAVDAAPAALIKRSQLRRADTGSLSAQLSGRTDGRRAVSSSRTHTSAQHFPIECSVKHTQSRNAANYHFSAMLPGGTVYWRTPLVHTPSTLMSTSPPPLPCFTCSPCSPTGILLYSTRD